MRDQEPFTQKRFFTPEKFAQKQIKRMESARGRLLIASCRSGTELAEKVVERYNMLLAENGSDEEVLFLPDIDYQFSDTETCVRLNLHVGGYDVFLFQALYNPILSQNVDQNYMAHLIATRAFLDHGARYITAVLPYLAYARQDKPTKFKREPATAKLMADLTIQAGMDRLITWNPHSSQVSAFYSGLRIDALDALTLFIDEFQHFQGRDDVIVVAPDAGASKFITYFSRALDLKSAIASKFRPRAEEAVITEIIGDFSGKQIAIVLDDMMSSGGTIYELVKKLVKSKGIREVYLGVSHNLCMPAAYERLVQLCADDCLKEFVVTNSIPQTDAFHQLPIIKVRCLSDILSRTINRIHYNHSVSDLFYNQQEG